MIKYNVRSLFKFNNLNTCTCIVHVHRDFTHASRNLVSRGKVTLSDQGLYKLQGSNWKLSEQGCRSHESSRLPPMWRGFDTWFWQFVVGSRPCPKGFSLGTPVHLPPHQISNLMWKQWREEPLRGFH